MYQTKCPACETEDCLYVISGVFQADMHLCSDGFCFTDAKQVDTEDETVKCASCERLFMLDDLYQDDEPEEPRLKVRED